MTILPLDTVLTSKYLCHVTNQYHGSAKKSLGSKVMNAISFPFLIAWLVGAILMAAGLVNIAGPRKLRDAYANWEFPPRFYLVAGVLELTAAAFLAVPGMRSWGIALAGLISFGAVVTLFNQRRYWSAVPVLILMVALLPASLAVPSETHQVHYANTLRAG